MNRILSAAALATLLAAGATAAQAQMQPLTEPPAGGQSTPQVGPGEKNETGNSELQSQITEDTSARVLPEVGADQAATAKTEETGVMHDAQPGGIVTPVQ